MDDRLVPLDGCVNFRDLGGWRTSDGRRIRSGRLYRSDALQRVTPADVKRLRDAIGLSTLVDLRSSHEVAREGRGLLESLPIAYHHLPFFDGPERDPGRSGLQNLAEIYLAMLRFARSPIARALDALAASPGAAVFHCAAGKDRTGVLSAVILGVAGVGDDDIVEDYAYTRHALPKILERLRASESYQYVFTELPPDTLHAEPETMERVLAEARREHGSMRDYLVGAGVGKETLERMEEALLEEA